jgi:hypothetical protein
MIFCEEYLTEGLFVDRKYKKYLDDYNRNIPESISIEEFANTSKSLSRCTDVIGMWDMIISNTTNTSAVCEFNQYLLYGKELVRCHIQSYLIFNDMKLVKIKMKSIKQVKFNKNNNLNIFYKVIKELHKVAIRDIRAFKDGIVIYFQDQQPNLINSIVKKYDDVIPEGNSNNAIMIKNKSSVKETVNLSLFEDMEFK